MSKPLVMELKALLSYILNTENKGLRRKTLELSMELLSEIRLNYVNAEHALKAEIQGEREEADKWIQKILDEVDQLEYSDE